jgi:hypothetical protein
VQALGRGPGNGVRSQQEAAIVKMLEGRSGDTYPGMAWEPKAAFTAVAESYRC